VIFCSICSHILSTSKGSVCGSNVSIFPQGSNQTLNVFIRERVNKIDSICRARRAVHDSSDTANKNEIDATVYENRQEFLELRAHCSRCPGWP